MATNVCIDAIARDERRSILAAKSAETDAPPLTDEVTWLQPIPDSLIEPTSQHDADPEAIALSRETIELAFLMVIQFLTPQQRARATLQRRLPSRRPEWPAGEDPSVAEHALLRKIVDASETADWYQAIPRFERWLSMCCALRKASSRRSWCLQALSFHGSGSP